jgi:MipA family protein
LKTVRFFRLKIIISIALLLIAGALIQPVSAQDLDLSMVKVKISTKKNTILGIGAGVYPDYEGSEEFTGLPLLQMRYNWNNGCYINLLGAGMRANIIPSCAFEFGPMVVYRPKRDSVDEKQVDKLKKVDAATEAGAFASWSIDKFTLLLQAHADTSGTHNGYLIDAGASYRIPLERKMQLILVALASYASDDYMDTYFSIDKENSELSECSELDPPLGPLPEYKADAGIKDVGLLAVLQYKLSNDWGLLGLLKYSCLVGDASDSPIVDDIGDANQLMTGFLVNYSF